MNNHSAQSNRDRSLSPIAFEALEPRRFMSATIVDRVLRIDSTVLDEHGQVAYTDRSIRVDVLYYDAGSTKLVDVYVEGRIGGFTAYLNRNDFDSILIEGTDEDDYLAIYHRDGDFDLACPVTLLGHGGDDVLFGGSQDDVIIGGDGNDRGRGFGGADVLDVERGINCFPEDTRQDDQTVRYFLDIFGPRQGRFGHKPGDLFANDPIESDPLDLIRGSAAWIGKTSPFLPAPPQEDQTQSSADDDDADDPGPLPAPAEAPPPAAPHPIKKQDDDPALWD